MEELLLVTDPMDERHSVQFELISSLGMELKKRFNVTVFSTYISEDKEKKLQSRGLKVIKGKNTFWINKFLSVLGMKNESMLWVESWFREAYLGRNSKEAMEIGSFQKIINMSTTIPIKCDILWIQGRSFFFTLEDIAKTNSRIRFALFFFGRSVRKRDKRLLDYLIGNTKRVITNASYLSSFYESMGYKADGIIYTMKDFSEFKPRLEGEKSSVLTYIGKETDIEPILALARRGVKIKGFGGKVPIGISLSAIRDTIEYLGYVTTDQLIALYSSALFTAFPFTEEPFGYVPIESMACGTPVLSYNKQGPAETIIDGKTGWLVSSREEFIETALRIWKNGHEMKKDDCVARASEFRVENSVRKLISFLEA